MKAIFFKLALLVSPVILLAVVTSQVRADDHPYGWSPQTDFSWQGTPTCSDPKPQKAPILLEPNNPALPKRPNANEVVLFWHKVPGATGYHVYYGLSPHNYIFSAPDLPDTNNFTVGMLPNRLFYFAVQAKAGCAASSLSNEWSARPGGAGGSNNYSNLLGMTNVVTPLAYQPPENQVALNPVTGSEEVAGVGSELAQVQPPVSDPVKPMTAPVPVKPKGFWAMVASILFGS